MKKSKKTPISSVPKATEGQQFVKYMNLLLLLMLVFVGVICLPALLEQTSLKKQNALVHKVHFQNGTISIVDLKIGDQVFQKQSVPKFLNKKDVIIVFLSPKKKMFLQKPSPACIWMVVFYFLLLSIVFASTVYCLIKF